MTSDDPLKRIEKGLVTVIANQHVIRNSLPGWFMYGLIGVAMVAGVRACDKAGDIEERLQQVPTIQTQNVFGNPNIPEKFYMIGGKRVYVEVDGKPAEQYFPK